MAAVAKLGLGLVILGLIPDLTAEYMLSFQLSEFADANAISEFVATEALALRLTGLYANGLYNLGGLVLTLVLLNEKSMPPPLAYFGIFVGCLGLSLSLFTLKENYSSSEWATVLAMSFSLIFMTFVNVICFSKDRTDRS